MPSLAISNTNLRFITYVDTSEVAMSMVLCQEQDGVCRPLAFYSKAFTGSGSIPIKEATAPHYFATGST